MVMETNKPDLVETPCTQKIGKVFYISIFSVTAGVSQELVPKSIFM
jgi:hypothetical protein